MSGRSFGAARSFFVHSRCATAFEARHPVLAGEVDVLGGEVDVLGRGVGVLGGGIDVLRGEVDVLRGGPGALRGALQVQNEDSTHGISSDQALVAFAFVVFFFAVLT
jgi:hypothetical protein